MEHTMMAIEITEKTWPVAAACLPGGFTARDLHRTMGSILVINHPKPEHFEETGKSPIVVLRNFWTTKRAFKKEFRFVDKKAKKTKFRKIERKF